MRARYSLALLLWSIAILAANAEVSSTLSGIGHSVIQMATPNALPSEVWTQVQSIPVNFLLNPAGGLHGDHSPAIAVNPYTHSPEVVWCYWDGNDTEIAWSRFDGTEWTTPELLTSNGVDDLAPNVAFTVNQATAVVWESHGARVRIEYRERSTNSAWSPQVHVSDESSDARTPVVVSYLGRIKVGYFQGQTGSSGAITVAGGIDDIDPWPSYFTPEIIAMISFSGDIAPELHSYPNSLFMTWVNSSTEIGFANFNGTSWQAPQMETYSSTEDLPRARIRAKGRALRNP